MVVEEVEDLGVGAVGEGPVGEVGLPELVGLIGGEEMSRRARTLAWLRDDQGIRAKDAVDRCAGRGGESLAFEPHGDCLSPCVLTCGGEVMAELEDALDELDWGGVGVVVRGPGTRLQRVRASEAPWVPFRS